MTQGWRETKLLPQKQRGRKKARKSEMHISVEVDLADIARPHFTSEGTDSETVPLYLSLKESIEKSKAEVVVMLLRVIAKGLNFVAGIADGNLLTAPGVATYLSTKMGVTPLFVKEVKTAAQNGVLYNLAINKPGLDMLMRHPRGLLKLSDNVGLQFPITPSRSFMWWCWEVYG